MSARSKGYPDKRAKRATGGVMVRWVISLAAILVFQLGALAIAGRPVAHAAPLAPTTTQNAIQIENQNPGDPTWDDFNAPTNPATLSGYASATSVNHGGSIDFYVTTTASSVQIDIFRTGWYGGIGARHMMTLGTYPGQAQPIPQPDPVTGEIDCNWQKTATLNVPTAWVTGVYLAKLTDSNGDKSFIFFVVRNDGGHEAIEFQSSVTTAQAYNTWGGLSLYANNGTNFNGPHAVKVSFDRPFDSGNGAGQYLWYEYPFVRWAESQGFDLTYVTNLDLQENTNPLTNHQAFLSVGHDEYWSMAMRTNLQNAINAGVNVAFFGGNEVYWQIRLEPNAAGVPDRVEVGYKDFATDTTFPGPDPEWNVNNSIVTSLWADPVVNMPQSAVTGLAYGDQLASNSTAYVVQNASNWIYANTGFTDGASVPGIVAYEYDTVATDGSAPAGLTLLSKSPVTGLNTGAGYAYSSIYTAASGAMVFNAGDIAWSWGLDNFGGRTTADSRIQQTTSNILYRFIGQTPPPPPPPPPAGQYFASGFETGSFSEWSGVSSTGTAQVESSIINSGSFAAQLTNSSGQSGYMFANLAGGPQTLTYTRFYFRIASPATTTTTLLAAMNSSGLPMVIVTYDAGRKGIDAYAWNGARARYDMYSNTNIVAPDAWYGLEVELNEQTSGGAQVWLNGASIATVSGDLSVSSGGGFNQLQLHNDGVGSVYYDDVISSDAYNGPVGGGYPGPIAVVNPTSLDFGNQNVGTTSVAQTVTLSDNGTAPLSVNGISITGTNASDFTQTSNCGSSVPVGQTCSIYVSFAPSKSTTRTATLTITDSDPSGTQSVALSGSGVYPPPPANGIYFSDGFESGNFANWGAPSGFGSATVETSVVNSGTYAVALVDGSGQYESLPATLIGGPEMLTYTRLYFRIASPVGGTETIAQGTDQNGNLLWIIVYDANRQGLDIYVWNGARTRYDMYSNTNVVLPDQWYGVEIEMNEQTSGSAQVWLNGATIGSVSGDLSVANGGGVASVGLENQVAGTIYFDDVITSNKYNGPVGNGYPGPTASISPSSLAFGDQNVGSISAAQTVTLTNTGTAPLSITGITVGGTNSSDFSQTNNCPATLAVQVSCTVSVTFSPAATGSRSGTLVFSDNDPSATQTVALSGNGTTPPPPPSGVYFSDGFESGSTSAWSAPIGNGTATVESTVVNSGTYALALSNASGQYETIAGSLVGGAETLTYSSFAFQLDSTAFSGTSTIARANDSSGNAMWVIYYDGSRKGLDIYVWNGARTRYDLYSNANIITAGTWYTLEIELDEQTNGTAQVWLNGASILTVSGDLSVGTGGGVSQMILWNEAAGTIYFDDAKVANVQ
jgi:type II secretory pathway pseudopilin PulG